MTATAVTGWPGDTLHGFLDSLPARPRLLGLGEPTHGMQDFLTARNDVFEHLVADEGYRSIAIESDCLAGLVVDEFVAGGAGSLQEVLRTGFSHGFGEYAGNRALIRRLRERNAGLPEADRVRFYGIDAPMEMMGAQSPRAALLALHGYLAEYLSDVPGSAAQLAELAGPDERWDNQDAMLDAAASIGAGPDAVRLRLLADDLGALLDTETPRLRADSPAAFWRAQLYARAAIGLCRYHATMASPGPARPRRLTALRDAMMADNLTAVAARERDRGPTLVFAHNAHLQRRKASMWLGERIEWWSAGSIVAADAGTRYAHLAMDLGAAPELGVPVPQPDTLPGVLGAATRQRRVFNSAHLVAALGDRLRTVVARTDTAQNHAYAPLDPGQLTEIDGLLFLPEVTG